MQLTIGCSGLAASVAFSAPQLVFAFVILFNTVAGRQRTEP